MRLGPVGQETPAVLTEEGPRTLAGVVDDFDGSFWRGGGASGLAARVDLGALPLVTDVEVRTGAPIPRPGKIVCVGLNYRDHAAETGAALPDEPILFMKDPGTVVGPHDPLLLPPTSRKTDWEVELGVVIGATARYLPDLDAALSVIGGFVVSHDVSEREYQLERGGQWDKGKSCETFNPLGPVLVTPDEVEAGSLGLRLWVNGIQRQDGSTRDLHFGVGHLIHYISQFMVLQPGDLINTGTPAGVALGLPGQPYLQEGDVVEVEIDGLGRQRTPVRRAEVTA